MFEQNLSINKKKYEIIEKKVENLKDFKIWMRKKEIKFIIISIYRVFSFDNKEKFLKDFSGFLVVEIQIFKIF